MWSAEKLNSGASADPAGRHGRHFERHRAAPAGQIGRCQLPSRASTTPVPNEQTCSPTGSEAVLRMVRQKA